MSAKPQNQSPRWTLDEWQQPSGPVGGDFIITRWREHGVRFFVADVTGHGAEAAAMAAVVRDLIEAHADDEITPQLLSGLSDRIETQFPCRFVCLTFVELDFRTRRATIFNAGNPPLIIRRGRRRGIETHPATGMPLGIVDSSSWTAPAFVQVALDPEDTVVCFTDGLPDQVGAGDGQFGLERIVETIQQSGSESPARRLGRRVASFADGAADQDDVTVLALRARAA